MISLVQLNLVRLHIDARPASNTSATFAHNDHTVAFNSPPSCMQLQYPVAFNSGYVGTLFAIALRFYPRNCLVNSHGIVLVSCMLSPGSVVQGFQSVMFFLDLGQRCHECVRKVAHSFPRVGGKPDPGPLWAPFRP